MSTICLSTVLLGGGIQKSLLVKNCGNVVSAEIQDSRLSKEKRQWPPTPQDRLEEKYGTVKLPKVKATKVSKTCDDIEILIPNAKPSLSQVLLSLNTCRKTGSPEVITDLHRIGNGLAK